MLGDEIPENARAVLAKATAYDERDRNAGVREFSADLVPGLSGRQFSRLHRRRVIGLLVSLVLASLLLAAIFRFRGAVAQGPLFITSPPFEVASVEETHITERKGNSDVPHPGANPDLSGAVGWRSYPLVRFDLSKFKGTRVVGPPTLKCHVQDDYGRVVQTHTDSLHTLRPQRPAATRTCSSLC